MAVSQDKSTVVVVRFSFKETEKRKNLKTGYCFANRFIFCH